ncbi:MAG: hypothetical protein E7396_00435 [Ruminococcaceae bacterium]|nr:hypothetical protein [Oscillospiraceae bacterium]
MKLKRFVSVFLIICLVLSILPVFADEEITVMVNGEKVVFDQEPVVENGRTLVPVRAIFEKLGARVSYEPERQKVYAEMGTRYVAFLIGADTIYTNDGGTKTDAPARIINDRTFVPVRAVSEGFGAKVSWDQATKTVTINSKGTNTVKYVYKSYSSYSQDNTIVLNGLCSYPEIKGDTDIVKALNKGFSDGTLDYIKYLSEEPTQAASSMYTEHKKSGNSSLFSPLDYKRTFDVSYNRGNVISFVFHTMSGRNGEFSEGAIKTGLTYDISTGQSVTKEAVFNLSKPELENLILSTFNNSIASNPDLYSHEASEYVNKNISNVGFYLDDYGAVFFFPAGTILNDKAAIPQIRIDYESNKDLFNITDFAKKSDSPKEEINTEAKEEPKEEVKEEAKEEIKEEPKTEIEKETEKPKTEEPKEQPKEETSDNQTKEEIKVRVPQEVISAIKDIYAKVTEEKQPEFTEPVNDKKYTVSFADNLYSKMPTDKNYMISPLSIKMALGLAATGAKGDTLNEIKDVMQISTIEEFNQRAKELIDIYKNTKELKLNVANSLWINTDSMDGMTFKPDYQEAVTAFYDAKVGNVDNSNAEEIINGWIKENTKGKIPSIVEDADFVTALINAVYFNGRWEHEFNKKATQPGEFADRNGKFNTIDFMRQIGKFNYFSNDKATVVELPYTRYFDNNGESFLSKDKAFSMYVVMPKFDTRIENIEKYLSDISMKNAYLDISLPKFKTEFSMNLNDVLKLMGMNTAFTNGADFSRMSDVSLMISDVIHKTYIDVNEEGTEAAAATAVIMKDTSSLITNEPVVVKIDKPFVYVIKDNVNDEILFIGEYAYVE